MKTPHSFTLDQWSRIACPGELRRERQRQHRAERARFEGVPGAKIGRAHV